MKSLLLPILLASMFFGHLQAQNSLKPDMLDFWVGNWQLTWKMQDGRIGKGTNKIVKILDDKVIQEHFRATNAGSMTGFKGASISVFKPQSNSWHQAWADNQGGYFNFYGSRDGDKFIFSTTEKNELIQRMVFYNISEQQLDWDWESSIDGGKNWKLNWRIHYEKVK